MIAGAAFGGVAALTFDDPALVLPATLAACAALVGVCQLLGRRVRG